MPNLSERCLPDPSRHHPRQQRSACQVLRHSVQRLHWSWQRHHLQLWHPSQLRRQAVLRHLPLPPAEGPPDLIFHSVWCRQLDLLPALFRRSSFGILELRPCRQVADWSSQQRRTRPLLRRQHWRLPGWHHRVGPRVVDRQLPARVLRGLEPQPHWCFPHLLLSGSLGSDFVQLMNWSCAWCTSPFVTKTKTFLVYRSWSAGSM